MNVGVGAIVGYCWLPLRIWKSGRESFLLVYDLGVEVLDLRRATDGLL